MPTSDPNPLLLFFSSTLLAICALYIIYSRSLWTEKEPPLTFERHIEGVEVLLAFAIYLFVGMFASISLLSLGIFFGILSSDLDISLYTAQHRAWMDLLSFSCAAIALLSFFLSFQKRFFFDILWQKQTTRHFPLFFKSLRQGALWWLLSFPFVLFTTSTSRLILPFFFEQAEEKEQVAVKHVKESLEDPLLFLVSSAFLILIVPFIEELLFRGSLHTWLRKFFSKNVAALFSSFIFSLFHFSFSQGLQNIEILLGLFVFSLFLSHVYERYSSLWACFSLHATFNAISIAVIVLLKSS